MYLLYIILKIKPLIKIKKPTDGRGKVVRPVPWAYYKPKVKLYQHKNNKINGAQERNNRPYYRKEILILDKTEKFKKPNK